MRPRFLIFTNNYTIGNRNYNNNYRPRRLVNNNYRPCVNMFAPIKKILTNQHNQINIINSKLNKYEPLFLEFYTLKMSVFDLTQKIEKINNYTYISIEDLKKQMYENNSSNQKSFTDLRNQQTVSDSNNQKSFTDLRNQQTVSDSNNQKSFTDLKKQLDDNQKSFTDLKKQFDDIKPLYDKDIIAITKMVCDELRPSINELFCNIINTEQDLDFLFEYFFHKSRIQVVNT